MHKKEDGFGFVLRETSPREHQGSWRERDRTRLYFKLLFPRGTWCTLFFFFLNVVPTGLCPGKSNKDLDCPYEQCLVILENTLNSLINWIVYKHTALVLMILNHLHFGILYVFNSRTLICSLTLHRLTPSASGTYAREGLSDTSGNYKK